MKQDDNQLRILLDLEQGLVLRGIITKNTTATMLNLIAREVIPETEVFVGS